MLGNAEVTECPPYRHLRARAWAVSSIAMSSTCRPTPTIRQYRSGSTFTHRSSPSDLFKLPLPVLAAHSNKPTEPGVLLGRDLITRAASPKPLTSTENQVAVVVFHTKSGVYHALQPGGLDALEAILSDISGHLER